MTNKFDAWKTRKENFPDVITLVREVKTTSISVTGSSCTLNCAHCNGRYLKSMKNVNFLDNCNFAEIDSFLISGGCDKNGCVPIVSYQEKLISLPDQVKINCHTGIATLEEAKIIASFADKVSFDFISDDKTIHDIYKLDRPHQQYIDSYINLSNCAKVSPHFCIGLLNPEDGDPSYEMRSLDVLSDLIRSKAVPSPEEIVFIIFTPTKGTDMESCPPPPISRVEKVLSYARLIFPDINLNLGCMRPFGAYRTIADQTAVDCGINLIVIPHESLDAYIEEKGLSIVEQNKCCVLANTRSE